MAAQIVCSGWAKHVGAQSRERSILPVGAEGSIGAVTSQVLKDVSDFIGRRKGHSRQVTLHEQMSAC